jgi:hypothetical protein
MLHPDHDCPPLVRQPNEAQQESRARRGEKRNLWTTRAGIAPLWTACGTPRFRATFNSGKSYFPHILLRRGHSRAQLREQEIWPAPAALRRARGNDSVRHRDSDA